MAANPFPDNDHPWRFNPLCEPHWRQWGDSYILFNAASGQTHFLNAFAFLALQLLRDTDTLTATELCAEIAALEDIPDGADLPRHVATLLMTMDELGLIEPLPHAPVRDQAAARHADNA